MQSVCCAAPVFQQAPAVGPPQAWSTEVPGEYNRRDGCSWAQILQGVSMSLPYKPAESTAYQ